MLAAVTDGPADLRRICFGPPAIQLGKIQPAINEHFHAAGSTRFPGASRGVHPQIHTLNQLLGHEQIVITQEDYARAYFRAIRTLDPLADHLLTLCVLWMSFASEDELNRMLAVGENVQQALRIAQEKIGTLVSGETASETESERVSIQRLGGCGKIFRGGTEAREPLNVPFTNIMNERLSTVGTKLP